jgi:hypothetical protein
MYIFQYFLIEKLFQGNRHLGVSDEQAIDGFVDLFSHGIWSAANGWQQPRSSSHLKHDLGPVNHKHRPRAYSR